MVEHNTELQKQRASQPLSPEEELLNAALDSVPDAELPAHVVARLVDIPRAYPRRKESSESWWPFDTWLPVLGWGVAAAVGIALGVVGPEEGPLEEPQDAVVADDSAADEMDEWQQLAQVALDSNWELED